MQLDKDELAFFPLKERRMLEGLAEEAGSTPFQYLIRLVRRRALGHLKDLGDDRGSFRLYEDDPPSVHVEAAEFRE